MAQLDTVLIANSDAVLVDALVQATAAANAEVRMLPVDRGHWEEFVPQIRGQREGRRQWSDVHRGETARVRLAWWTDRLGRRHCRVLGGNSRDGSYRQLTALHADPRPPLWQVYPDRVFYRTRAGVDAWLTVCACGVAGEPDAIGWTGTRCAACHDRHEEGLPPVPETNSVATFVHLGSHSAFRRFPGVAPVFSPDGQWLATVQRPGASVAMVCLLRAGVTAVQMAMTREEPACLVFSPDGQRLAFTEGEDRLLVREVMSGDLVLDALLDAPLAQVQFSPDGRGLVGVGPEMLMYWRRRDVDAAWTLMGAREQEATAAAFSPGGEWLAVGDLHRLHLFNTVADDLTPVQVFAYEAPRPLAQLQFVDGGRELLCLYTHAFARVALLFDEPSGPGVTTRVARYAYEWGRFRFSGQQDIPDVGLACLSPDGETVVAGDERLTTFSSSPPGRATLSGLGWDINKEVTAFRLSPDGETLLLVNDHGTGKLLPWRLLLQAGTASPLPPARTQPVERIFRIPSDFVTTSAWSQ
ncbi:MAG: WD40 repeat domain-containing protein [Gemmataceae bacterium]